MTLGRIPVRTKYLENLLWSGEDVAICDAGSADGLKAEQKSRSGSRGKRVDEMLCVMCRGENISYTRNSVVIEDNDKDQRASATVNVSRCHVQSSRRFTRTAHSLHTSIIVEVYISGKLGYRRVCKGHVRLTHLIRGHDEDDICGETFVHSSFALKHRKTL